MAARVYALLLRLLPKAFRTEYGAELEADFDIRHGQASFPGKTRLWLESIPDIAITAAREHLAVLTQDLRQSLRSFVKRPGYPIVVVSIVALGVGANTAIFTVVDHTLVRPFPYPEPDRLVQLWESKPAMGYPQVEPAPANYYDWAEQNQVFEAMAAYTNRTVNLTSDDSRPERVRGEQVTSSLFRVLDVPAALGRTLQAQDDDDSAPPVVVLGHGWWQRRFGGDPTILGGTLRFDGVPHEVVGIMPPSFHFPRPSVQFWVPVQLSPYDRADRSNHCAHVVARLSADTTLEQADAGMRQVAANLADAFPDSNAGATVLTRSLRDETSRQSRTALIVLLAAAIGVLLIGCANLANLMFARAIERRRELAMRVALGAGFDRLVRQLLSENLLLALSGGLLGIAGAQALLPLLSHLVPADLPIAASLSLDGRVLGFGIAASLLTGVAFALVPAWQSSRDATGPAVKEGSRDGVGGRRARVRNTLVVVEVAVSVMLLIGAGLLIRALGQVTAVEPGFRTQNVLTLRSALPLSTYDEMEQREAFYGEVLRRVRALPGVENAGYTGFLPFVMRGVVWPVGAPGITADDDRPQPLAVFREVTEGYFETLDVRLTQGRYFDSRDTADSTRMAIVSEAFARRIFPDRDPVGATFEFRVPWMQGQWTVAGVVADFRTRRLEQAPMPLAYVLHRQMTVASFHAPRDLAVHYRGDAQSLIPELRKIIWDIDPELPISDVQTMQELLAAETVDRRRQLRLLGVFAGLAFVLAGLGIHGLLAFVVSQRTQEIGVRMALGATAATVARGVVGQGLALTALGLVLGVAGGIGLGQAMQHLLFNVAPFDPLVLLASIGLGVGVSVVACGLPAWRAARVDPMVAVRAE